ncbi:hypothetical protein Tco_1568496 [Tanacetum coccineum]
MSSITSQQTKLDLKLVPKVKRLDIGKCNGRLIPRKIQREPTFQVVLDALALTPCYSAFLITTDVPHVYMHQFWDSVYKYDTFYRFKIDKRKRFKLNLEILVTLGATPPKKAQKFKKPVSPKLNTVPVSTEELTRKSKRVKRPAKKSTKASARGFLFEKLLRCHCLGRKKRCMLLKTHPSGSIAIKIIPSVTNEGTGVKPGVLDVTEEESSKKTDENESGSESNQEEGKDNEEEVKDELVKTTSNNSDDEDGFAAVLAVLVTEASQSRQHDKGSRLDLCTLVFVIEGWSRLPPIQYQQSRSEMSIDNVLTDVARVEVDEVESDPTPNKSKLFSILPLRLLTDLLQLPNDSSGILSPHYPNPLAD